MVGLNGVEERLTVVLRDHSTGQIDPVLASLHGGVEFVFKSLGRRQEISAACSMSGVGVGLARGSTAFTDEGIDVAVVINQ